MPEPITEYADSARRVFDNTPKDPLDAFPYHERSEEGKPDADEVTKAEVAARLVDLPEELESPRDEEVTEEDTGTWSLKTHYGKDGTLIVNLLSRRSKSGDMITTTFHLKPDFDIKVFPDVGGVDPIPLSQPLADALLEILPKNNTISPELYERVSPEK